jgi:prephenate dehydrogenase
VILATPVSSFARIAKEIGSVLHKGAIVTDVGSVKMGFLSEVENALPEGVHFVGTHPIAGTERSGAEASFLELFQGAKCIITPTPRTDENALRTLEELWKIAGSEVIVMDPVKHDRILAAVSHLPHVIAYVLVNTLVDIDDIEKDVFAFAAGGFKDFTRIASSSPEMWADICFLNKNCIIDSINRFKHSRT